MQLKARAWGRRQDREGLSLVVQWLRPCAPNAGGPGSISGQGTRSYVSQLLHAATKDPACHN